jgi:hypothetical protein
MLISRAVRDAWGSRLASWGGAQVAGLLKTQTGTKLLPACALAAVAIWCIAFYATLPARLPSDADYRRAVARVRAGDEVVVHPAWADRVRQFVRGAPVHTAPELAQGDRVWLIALDRAPGAGPLPAMPGRVAEGPFRDGALWSALYERPAEERPLYNFRARIAEARVRVGSVDCPWKGGRYECGPRDWEHVGAEVREVDRLPRACVWAHPSERGPVRIAFPRARLGTRIEGGGGIATTGAFAVSEHAPVVLSVRAGGLVVGAFAFAGSGWTPFSAPTRPGESEVVFEVAASESGWRHFCFAAQSLP